MKYKAPRGTHDLWLKSASDLRNLENTARRVFKNFNYKEVVFPTFEDTNLFTRTIGETTDIVEKEMYAFTDRKGRPLALRPEGTASVARMYIEHNLANEPEISKYFYMGSMFRYERPQSGRYREFYQIGAEYIGNPGPSADAEIILLSKSVLEASGIGDIAIHINSLGCDKCRVPFRDALKHFFSPDKNKKLAEEICSDCKRRIAKNPLRVLDCKIDGHKFSGVPKMEDYLCEECKCHFNEVRALLDKSGCTYQVNHKLVRGLDYYTKTIFEIRSEALGSQDAVAAGGRYDNLIKGLGGSDTPAVGFALGSERAIMSKKGTAGEEDDIIFIAVSNSAMNNDAFGIADELRKRAIELSLNIVIEGPISGKSLKSQLKTANKIGACKTVILGEEEYKNDILLLRDMGTSEQSEIHKKDLKDKIF